MKRLVALLICVGLGCGKPPQFSTPEQQKLLKRFESLVEQKKPGPMEQMAKQVDDLHKKGRLTDEQHALLKKVCEKAITGDWDDADALLKPVVAAQGKSK